MEKSVKISHSVFIVQKLSATVKNRITKNKGNFFLFEDLI